MRTQHNRFKDAPWYQKDEESRLRIVLVGGAGGIGSWTTLLLSRAGFKPVVYDFDTLEEHNMGGQLFPKRLVGTSKVSALADVVKDFCDEVLFTSDTKMDADSPTETFVISAFDNMKARQEMFANWLISNSGNPNAIFIDGRLNAEQMQIFCVRGNDAENIKEYAQTHLFDDSEVEDAPCTMKQTSHAAAMIAAHIVGFFTNHITNVVEKDNTRSVPFMWEYFIPMDLLQQS